MAKHVCKTVTLAQRVDVLNRLEKNCSQTEVALELGINQSQISCIWKNKEKILLELQNSNPDRKCKCGGKSEDVEEALLRWFSQARSHQIRVSGPLLMEKAEQLSRGLALADFKATTGWLEQWKMRNAVQFKKLHGEKQDADVFGAERWVTEVLPEFLLTTTHATSSTQTRRGFTGERYETACCHSRASKQQAPR